MTLVRSLAQMSLLIGAFVGSFVTARMVAEVPEPEGTMARGGRVYRYDPGYLNRVTESVSGDGLFTAAVGAAGWREDVADGRRDLVGVLSIAEGDHAVVKLAQIGDAAAGWSEYGHIEWIGPGSARFSYAGGSAPLESFRIVLFADAH